MNAHPDTASSGGFQQKVFRFAPGLEALAHYKPSWLSHDVAAGLSVAAVTAFRGRNDG